MPYRTFTTGNPNTAWGVGLNNIANSIYNNALAQRQMEMEAPLRAAQTSAYEQHAELYRAQAQKMAAEAAAAQVARQQAENLPQTIATGVFGDQARGQEYLAQQRLGQWSPVGAEGPVVPQRPEWATPERTGLANRLLMVPGMIAATGGANRAGAIDDVLKAIYTQELQGRAMEGQVRPQQAEALGMTTAALGGKPIYGGPAEITRNLYTGVSQATPVGQSAIALDTARSGTERARQGELGTRSASNVATTNLRNTQRAGEEMVAIPDPANEGGAVRVRAQDLGREAAQRVYTERQPRAAPQQKPPTPDKPMDERRRAENIVASFPEGVTDQIKQEVMSRVLAGETDEQIVADLQQRVKPGRLYGHNVAPRGQAAAPATAAPGSGPKQIRNRAEYDAIRPGERYIDPNGVARVKGGG